MTVDPMTLVQLPVYAHEARVLSLTCSPLYLVVSYVQSPSRSWNAVPAARKKKRSFSEAL
jgi:hypothetical protein